MYMQYWSFCRKQWLKMCTGHFSGKCQSTCNIYISWKCWQGPFCTRSLVSCCSSLGDLGKIFSTKFHDNDQRTCNLDENIRSWWIVLHVLQCSVQLFWRFGSGIVSILRYRLIDEKWIRRLKDSEKERVCYERWIFLWVSFNLKP